MIVWLQDYLKEQFKNKNIFIKETLFPTTPLRYNLNFNEEKNTLTVDLEFTAKDDLEEEDSDEDQDHETTEQITLNGKLVRLGDGNISIDWYNA